MGKIDLHMHSTSSDGVLVPEELVAYAASQGVTVMALTDHDTFDGVDRLRGADTAIPVVTGIELSMADMHGLHLLGYGETDAPELRAAVHQLAEYRLGRAQLMVEKLAELGCSLDYDSICRSAGGSVGRPHIARAMVEAGFVRDMRQAFDRFIGDDGPAYVPHIRLTMEDAIPLLRRNGFVPVLAHPAEVTLNHQHLRTLLDKWRALGLMGMEAYHPANRRMGFANLDSMARSMGLLVTGGSDFHAQGDETHGLPGCMARHWLRMEEDFAALQTAIRRMAT